MNELQILTTEIAGHLGKPWKPVTDFTRGGGTMTINLSRSDGRATGGIHSMGPCR